MKVSKKIAAFLDHSKSADSYWVEEAKLNFSTSLETQRRSANLTYAAIAKKIGSSAAYITKVFRGDSNLTIETMVKLARSTGCKLEIRVVEACAQSDERILSSQAKASFKTTLNIPSIAEIPTKPMELTPSDRTDRGFKLKNKLTG